MGSRQKKLKRYKKAVKNLDKALELAKRFKRAASGKGSWDDVLPR